MKLMVAGCSFSAPSKTLPGTSWSELLANKLGWDLENLARQGCSNGGIRIQIDEIRRQRPDFAIITPTFWDRLEIPANSAPYDWSQPASSGDNPPLEQHLRDKTLGIGYRREDGIRNVNYGDKPSNMICETIFTLAENFDHPYRMSRISRDAQRGIRAWVDTIYDNAWKKQCDEWIMREAAMITFLDGIRFLFVPVLLWPFDPEYPEQWRDAFPKNLIPDEYIMLNENESPLSICGFNGWIEEDPGYHSSPEGQVIIAENYYRRIQAILSETKF